MGFRRFWIGAVAALVAFAMSTLSFAQTDSGSNPTYKQGAPLYSAQTDAGKAVVYDSYWINKDGWRIHCSQDEFCYLKFGWIGGASYSGTEVSNPPYFDPDTQAEHSFALGIKSGSRRTTFSMPYFKYNERIYTANWKDYEGKDRPSGKIAYFIDDKFVTSRPFKNKIPMRFSMFTDWEPETGDIMDQLVGTLYHNDPKELIAIVYFDETPVVGTKLNVKGFKAAYDEMHKELKARRELAKTNPDKFVSWPTTHVQ